MLLLRIRILTLRKNKKKLLIYESDMIIKTVGFRISCFIHSTTQSTRTLNVGGSIKCAHSA